MPSYQMHTPFPLVPSVAAEVLLPVAPIWLRPPKYGTVGLSSAHFILLAGLPHPIQPAGPLLYLLPLLSAYSFSGIKD